MWLAETSDNTRLYIRSNKLRSEVLIDLLKTLGEAPQVLNLTTS